MTVEEQLEFLAGAAGVSRIVNVDSDGEDDGADSDVLDDMVYPALLPAEDVHFFSAIGDAVRPPGLTSAACVTA